MYQRCGCENCGCHNGCDSCQEELLLGMVRIADHAFENAYEFERALARGTLFPELDKPFYGKVKGGCGCD